MAKPTLIKRGSVVVKIYRVKHASAAAGCVFSVSWHAGGKRMLRQFTDFKRAKEEATLKAEQLNAGRMETASTITGDDGATLAEARLICGDTPFLAALKEWAKASKLTDGHVLTAAQEWVDRNRATFKRITVKAAVEAFIAWKESAGKQGEQTYRAKLTPLVNAFETRNLDELSATALDTYLTGFANGVTRNDHRKRAVALWRWAQKAGHLPRGAQLEIELTERAGEESQKIGVISPSTYEKLLVYFRDNYAQYLGALVLAGFCGIRADELQGKRHDRGLRQLWEDVSVDRPTMRVTVAKKGTASYRPVPLCNAARAWLRLCPNREGPVCEPLAIDTIRRIVREAKNPTTGEALFAPLPENCFRHSFCTYRVALTGNVQQVALEAGNSPALLRKHYFELAEKADGKAWFAILPAASPRSVPRQQPIAA